MTAAERATDAARAGAAEHRAQTEPEPGVLVLPDGWRRQDGPGGLYCQADLFDERERVMVYADREGVLTAGRIRREHSADDARALAARLVEAAGIVEQLRAGAR